MMKKVLEITEIATLPKRAYSFQTSYGTRSCNTIRIHFYRISQCQGSIFYNAPRIFIELPYQITSRPNLNSFKRKLKEFLN